MDYESYAREYEYFEIKPFSFKNPLAQIMRSLVEKGQFLNDNITNGNTKTES